MARNGAYKNRIIGTDVVPAGQLLANPMNWRVHPRHQQQALDAVLQDVGWVDDVIVNQRTGHIIDGHLRVTLALRQGEDTPVPVKYVDLSEDEERLILATFDPISALAAVDEDVLAELLESVHTEDEIIAGLLEQVADDAGIGLATDEPPEDPGAQIDRADELREKWSTEPGQLWRIPSNSVPGGEHRIVCGDCTDPAVVERVMQGERADLVITDPPYGVGIDYGDNVNDTRENTMRLAQAVVPLVRQIAPMVFWVSGGLSLLEWYYRNLPPDWIVAWYKGSPGHRSYIGFNDWEAILVYGKRKGVQMHDYLDIRPSEKMGEYGHPVPKPVEWVEWFIERASDPGGVILDPFVGSGTTLVACERLGRLGRGIEIEPKYVAVALQRLADMGLQPELVE